MPPPDRPAAPRRVAPLLAKLDARRRAEPTAPSRSVPTSPARLRTALDRPSHAGPVHQFDRGLRVSV